MGLVGSGDGVLLGSGGWSGGASWDGADLVQRVNNLSIWIGSRVVLGSCRSAAPRLIDGRIPSSISGIGVLCRFCLSLCGGSGCQVPGLALRSRLLWSWQRNLEQVLTSNIL